MPDDGPIAVVTPEGLDELIGRLARLQMTLEGIAAARDLLLDKELATWFAACRQLQAVLEFVEDSDELMPELHKLHYAVIDLKHGKKVAWLEPAEKKGQGQPSGFEDATIHGRFAAVMNWLMEQGGKGKQEAAEFVVEHGGLRRWLNLRGRRNSAADWKQVANWRDRASALSPPSPELAAWERTDEIIDGMGRIGGDVEGKAKKLLRAIKIYFDLG